MKCITGLLVATLLLAGAGIVLADNPLSINGAGATFPYPMYSKWFDEYHKENPTSRSTTSRSAPAAASSKSPKAPWISAPPTAP